MKPTMRKLGVCALLISIVLAWSFLPVLSAKKPPNAYVTLGPEGALVTVGDSCDGVIVKPTTAAAIPMSYHPGGSYMSLGPVAVWFDFDLQHVRYDGEPLTLPGCLLANRLREVSFDGDELLSLRMPNIEGRDWKEGKTIHYDRYLFEASDDDLDGTFDSVLRYSIRHKGKNAPPGEVEFVFQDELRITGTVS